jgi:gamma-glutamyltranspeptidase/glutathione hydrolase
VLSWLLLLTACRRPAAIETPTPTPASADAPELSTGCRGEITGTYGMGGGMVVSAHPEASRIGADVLRAGGSAADAAAAMAVALTLVEPQSSGIGGGAFILHYNADQRELLAYDGRETAPSTFAPEAFLDATGERRPFPELVQSGLSVGAPGLVRLLEQLHEEHGTLPWADLFTPTADLAETGFTVTPRMSRSITSFSGGEGSFMDTLHHHAPATDYFLPGGSPLSAGDLLKNPALAQSIRTIAAGGADAFYSGPLAEQIVATVQASPRPGALTLNDLAAYRSVKRAPVCIEYQGDRQLCGHPPPTSGGVTVLQILGILDSIEDRSEGPHQLIEATRLAWADRGAYLGDPRTLAEGTVEAMLDPDYLRERATLIGEVALADIQPGSFALPPPPAAELCPEGNDTTHLIAVDRDGDVVSMTSSIENAFGSGLMVGGFLLNNQLTDFDGPGHPNAPAACKRPRSSMAPVMVLDENGEVELAVGSPGGARIISYVARVIDQVYTEEIDIQAAISRPNVTGWGELESGCGTPALGPADVAALQDLGHERAHLESVRLNSGLHGIQRVGDGWLGGVDPRREGEAIVVE